MVVCGCYRVAPSGTQQYLPQLEINAHTTIYATVSSTTLTQYFANPSTQPIDESLYMFPLYDGVTVVGFRCTIGERVLEGVVKEREQAKSDYDEARHRGQTAGLFEQSLAAADVFTTSLGNVGGGETVKVEITFLGELKHDAETDGVRFTLPSSLSPRYGEALSLPGTQFNTKGMSSFTLDAEAPEGSTITGIQSPSHTIAVALGTISATPDETPSLRKASATLYQGTVELGADIIIQVMMTHLCDPSAVVESHPAVNSQALMVTLVPQFSLPAEKPEIVFVCDRSGSMGSSIDDLKQALRIFLKSLPVGVKFNICSFGSRCSFLCPASMTYDKESLAQSFAHVETFAADYGGTEMIKPMKQTFAKRCKDMNLEVFLITDGEIWGQDQLFSLVNEQVTNSEGAIRVFTLGVGVGASSSLVEGVARAGNGFAQTTSPGENMTKKVVRMLRGALFPHINDYSMDVKYKAAATPESSDEVMPLIEGVKIALVISPLEDHGRFTEGSTPVEETQGSRPANNEIFPRDLEEEPIPDKSIAKYSTLPAVEVPRYLQTPTVIPPLFPFNRTTVYVIIRGHSQVPEAVILKGTSQHGPLELEIPVTSKADGTTLHQLAARREIAELEQGRGWLTYAELEDKAQEPMESKERPTLFKDKYAAVFPGMVEREAVRLGTTYQVAGRYTSLVAVERQDEDADEDATEIDPSILLTDKSSSPPAAKKMKRSRAIPLANTARGLGSAFKRRMLSPGGQVEAAQAAQAQAQCQGSAQQQLGSPAYAQRMQQIQAQQQAQRQHQLSQQQQAQQHLAQQQIQLALTSLRPMQQHAVVPQLLQQQRPQHLQQQQQQQQSFYTGSYQRTPAPPPPPDPLHTLAALQSFDGSWSWSPELRFALTVSPDAARSLALPSRAAANGGNNDVFATACAAVFFLTRLAADKDVWELIVEKAEAWLSGKVGDVPALLEAVKGLFPVRKGVPPHDKERNVCSKKTAASVN